MQQSITLWLSCPHLMATTVETQAFSAWVHAGAQYSLLIDGVNTSAGVFDFTASGNVSGPIIVVPNGGCELVCLSIAFPFRCPFPPRIHTVMAELTKAVRLP
jgi:hypothetical protein